MNAYFFATLFTVLAAANAGVLVGPSANIIQGPSSRTTVVGPDGSAISSIAPGGQIVHEQSLGVVAHAAPVVASAPAVAYSAHSLVAPAHQVVSTYSAPLLSAAPVVSAYSARVVSGVVAQSVVDTVVAGPSGTIATGRGLAAAPIVSAW